MTLPYKVLIAAVACAIAGYFLLLLVLARAPVGAAPEVAVDARARSGPDASRAPGTGDGATIAPAASGPRIVLSPRSTFDGAGVTDPAAVAGGSGTPAAPAAPGNPAANAAASAPVDPFADDIGSVRRRRELMNIVVAAPDQVAARLRVEPEDVHRVAKGLRPLPQLWVDRWFAQQQQ